VADASDSFVVLGGFIASGTQNSRLGSAALGDAAIARRSAYEGNKAN
jgi:hypothetical protein